VLNVELREGNRNEKEGLDLTLVIVAKVRDVLDPWGF